MVRDRTILSKFLTHMVVQEYPVQREKFQFSTRGGHLGFLTKERATVADCLKIIKMPKNWNIVTSFIKFAQKMDIHG